MKSVSPTNGRIRLVVLTGDQLRHRYFVSRLASQCEVAGVVVEPVFAPAAPDDAPSADADVLARHFAERDRAEEQFFTGFREWPAAAGGIRAIPKGDLNDPAVLSWIESCGPDILVVYGSSLLGEALLTAFAGRCVNMHLGLSPYYRGSATNFWPLVNREPELVGATIHMVTSRIDGGAILVQARPRLQHADRAHEIGCRAIIAGTDAMLDALTRFDRAAVSAVAQSASGRLYRRRDFSAEAVRTMWTQFETGMIPEYLADPARAGRYPLVSLAD